MANVPKIVVHVDWMFSKEKFSGEECATCKDCIYGDGFRMVMVTKTSKNVLPTFKETNIVLCQPCKDAIK